MKRALVASVAKVEDVVQEKFPVLFCPSNKKIQAAPLGGGQKPGTHHRDPDFTFSVINVKK